MQTNPATSLTDSAAQLRMAIVRTAPAGVDPGRLLLTNGGSEAIALVAAEVGGRVAAEPEFSLLPRGAGGPVWRSDPHSPSGALAGPADHADVWDEAYYPLAAGRWTADRGCTVGSLTKVFACPGLRLGFVLGDDAERIARRQPAWSVGSVALAVVVDLLARHRSPGLVRGHRPAADRARRPPRRPRPRRRRRRRALGAGPRPRPPRPARPPRRGGPRLRQLRATRPRPDRRTRRGRPRPPRHRPGADRVSIDLTRHPHLAASLAAVAPLDVAAVAEATARQADLTKPPGSLGRLEALGIQLAGIAGTCPPPRARSRRRRRVRGRPRRGGRGRHRVAVGDHRPDGGQLRAGWCRHQRAGPPGRRHRHRRRRRGRRRPHRHRRRCRRPAPRQGARRHRQPRRWPRHGGRRRPCCPRDRRRRGCRSGGRRRPGARHRRHGDRQHHPGRGRDRRRSPASGPTRSPATAPVSTTPAGRARSPSSTGPWPGSRRRPMASPSSPRSVASRSPPSPGSSSVGSPGASPWWSMA